MNRKENEEMGGVSFLARRLGVSESTIYSAIRKGTDLPPCLQIGSRKIWRAKIIDAWREQNGAKPEVNILRSECGTKTHQGTNSPHQGKSGRPTKTEQIKRPVGNNL